MLGNKVGLEAEFFVYKENKIVFPEDYGFGVDDFPLIGEVRAEPGKSSAETTANFLKEWFRVVERAQKMGLEIEISSGYVEISPEKYAQTLRRMGTKVISECANIYPEIDLLKLSDAVIEDGKILKHLISNGLHLHFSSQAIYTNFFSRGVEEYSPITVRSLPGTTLFYKTGEKEVSETITATVSRITRPVLHHFVSYLDENVLPKYRPSNDLKYRNPGFYELKSHGFEYRSLPFSTEILGDIHEIVCTCFKLLNDLSL